MFLTEVAASRGLNQFECLTLFGRSIEMERKEGRKEGRCCWRDKWQRTDAACRRGARDRSVVQYLEEGVVTGRFSSE